VKVIYYICKPVCLLLSFFWPQIELQVAILLQVHSTARRSVIWALANHETGGFTNINTSRNNFFSFAYVGHFLQISESNSDVTKSLKFAVYKDSYDSVKHLLLWIASHNAANSAYKEISSDYYRETVYNFALALKRNNYYTADVVSYSAALWHWTQTNPFSSAPSILALVLSMLIFIRIAYVALVAFLNRI